MCRVSLDIVALALFTSYRGVVSEPRGIRISRCVFKYCCGVEFPSILWKFAPPLSPFTQVYPGIPVADPPPPYLRVWMTARLPLISRSGSGIVYWLKATHCWGNHCSCAPLPPFTFIYLCELTTILVNFSWET